MSYGGSYFYGGRLHYARSAQASFPLAQHATAARLRCAARSGAIHGALLVAGVSLDPVEAKAGEFGESACTTLFCAGMSRLSSTSAHVPPDGERLLYTTRPHRTPQSSAYSSAALLDVSIERCHARRCASAQIWRRSQVRQVRAASRGREIYAALGFICCNGAMPRLGHECSGEVRRCRLQTLGCGRAVHLRRAARR